MILKRKIVPPMLILQSTVTFQTHGRLDRTAQRTWWVPLERDSLCSFSFSFSIVPHFPFPIFRPSHRLINPCAARHRGGGSTTMPDARC